MRGKGFVAGVCMAVMLMFSMPMISFAQQGQRGDAAQYKPQYQQREYQQQRWKNQPERRAWYNSGYWVIDKHGNRVFVKRGGHKYYR